ncbi:NAD(P)H-binding protein [Jonesiaceae bacterium BS-20]|uniref:NAD(P)H-binding protein n=1 Tax=Jonesiaceae bacterium BS-20 TaxID=3120821 RepID=A0AAU7E041_9MICO
MANIILFGGHGKIALLTEPLLVERGDTITAVIRNPAQSDAVAATGATPQVADVEQLSVADLAQIIAGHDAVVWSAGAGGGNPARTYAVDQDAAIRTMEAAQLAGVRRYVMVSYFDAAIEHGVPAENSFFAYAQAKAAADQHLRATELDWTVLGPSALTLEEPTGAIDTKAEKSTQVSRANVAAVIARVLESPSTVRQTINFNDGDTPIEQAI